MFPSSARRVLAIAQLIRAQFLHRGYVTVTNGDKSGVSLPESAKKAAAQQSAHLTQMTKPELDVPAGASVHEPHSWRGSGVEREAVITARPVQMDSQESSGATQMAENRSAFIFYWV